MSDIDAMASVADDQPNDFVDGVLRFRLRKPINAHGKDVEEITIREPDGKDLIAVGNPVHYDPISTPVRIIPDADRMAAMISRLANIPPSSVAQISPKEQVQIAWILAPFFIPV